MGWAWSLENLIRGTAAAIAAEKTLETGHLPMQIHNSAAHPCVEQRELYNRAVAMPLGVKNLAPPFQAPPVPVPDTRAVISEAQQPQQQQWGASTDTYQCVHHQVFNTALMPLQGNSSSIVLRSCHAI